MTNFEKVEKLVQKANVSYEEAKAALDKADGDLLDAIIILEKEGKTQAPRQSSFSTEYEQQTQYVSVPARVEDDRRSYDREEQRRERRERALSRVPGAAKAGSVRIGRNSQNSLSETSRKRGKRRLWRAEGSSGGSHED